MTLKRDFRTLSAPAGPPGANGHSETGDAQPILDMLIIGAGFSGVWLTHCLRQCGFNVKIVEAGSDLGGVWYWNRYPGARVDSQYPLYALSIPEVYRDWTWKSHYPDHEELREYFAHIESRLGIKKDCVFDTEVVAASWDDIECYWTVTCLTGRTFKTRFLSACTGFATKRAFPDWEGLDEFKGQIYHSSFWPTEAVDVKGKRLAVIGTGSTGVQITQQWAREIGETGSLKMFQRTPNLACPMNQVFMTQQEQAARELAELFAQRNSYYGGFLWQSSESLSTNSSEAEQNEFFAKLWKMGGFRFLMNNYQDMMRDPVPNRAAYNFWRDRVRERVKDPRKQQLLAPTEPPHPFGGKRLSLEQDFYEQFNKPNVDVIDVRNNPIRRLRADGIVQADGTFHPVDAIALATGFDAITGGLKNLQIKGVNGKILSNKWATGTRTYLGLATAGFPNFFFTYGPQAPTAFSNGPTCIEIQGNWITQLLTDMREAGYRRIEAQVEAETVWKGHVGEAMHGSLREGVDSWYNGANIPGKPREHLNYAGGIPRYRQILSDVRVKGYEGFKLSSTSQRSARI